MEKLFDQAFWDKLATAVTDWFVNVFPSLLLTLLFLILSIRVFTFLVKKVKNRLKQKIMKQEQPDTEMEKRMDTLTGIVSGVGLVIIWTVFLIILLGKIGLDIAPLLAGAGIVGLAVGFGAQELVRDYITGFFILLENQVRTGDVAIINGTGGLVEKIEMRTITLRDLSGTVHVFQNGKINSLSNMTKEWSAMVLDIGVAYKEDTDKVIDIMGKVGEQLQSDPEFKEKILEPIEIFGVDNFADSAVVIKARWKTKPIMQWAVGREYRSRLKKAFDQEGIEIPFPHISLYWGENINPLQVQMNQ